MTDTDQPSNSSDGIPTERSTLDWAVQAGLSNEILRELNARRRRRRAIGCTIAAALVAGGFVWQAKSFFNDGRSPAAITAIVTQPKTQLLPDGSVAELKSDAIIRVEFSDALRRVVLERGEAHFKVKKDPVHPFVVAVGELEVRAVGTAFAVQRGGDAIAVVVTEGRVAVESVIRSSTFFKTVEPSRTFVDAGQRVSVNETQVRNDGFHPGWPVDRLSSAELAESQAWRVPRLEFSGTPLAEALPLFNQHSRVQLTLGDPALGRLRLSGVIQADNTEALLRLLGTNFKITAEHQSVTEITLRQTR